MKLFESIYKTSFSRLIESDEKEISFSKNYENEVDLHDMLKPAIEAYQEVISAQRYADAGYDYSNVDHAADEEAIPNNDSKIIKELKKLGINTKEDLKELLYSNGVDSKTLVNIQKPYNDQIVEPDTYYKRRHWSQVKNPDYAKPIHGITYDDVFCIQKFFELLPSDNSKHNFDLRSNQDNDDYSKKEAQLEKDEKIIQLAAKKYPSAFDYKWSKDIAIEGRSPMDNTSFDGRCEATHSLARICKKYLKIDDIDAFKAEVINLAYTGTYPLSHWNFYIK